MSKGSGGGAGPRGNESGGNKTQGKTGEGRKGVEVSNRSLKAGRNFFGSDVRLADIANAVEGGKLSARLEGGKLVLRSNFAGVEADRIITRENGELVAHNEFFGISERSKFKGQGAALFARQAAALQAAGVSRIVTTAAGSFNNQFGFNGYYTWARMGYDGAVPHGTWDNLPQGMRAKMGASRSVQDLMALPGGKEAWKQHGATFKGTFSLRHGSRSQKVLAAYMKERATRGK